VKTLIDGNAMTSARYNGTGTSQIIDGGWLA